jgi:hypothetical protein
MSHNCARKDEVVSTERDTHFQGFARLLWDEIEDEIIVTGDNSKEALLARRSHPLPPAMSEEMELLIARRAYDLVYFLLNTAEYHSGSFDVGWGTPDEIHETISHLPDLTEWPVERDEPT